MKPRSAKVCAQARVHLRAGDDRLAGAVAHDEVEEAAAHPALFAELGVHVRQRQDRLRGDRPLRDHDRQLAATARDDLARARRRGRRGRRAPSSACSDSSPTAASDTIAWMRLPSPACSVAKQSLPVLRLKTMRPATAAVTPVSAPASRSPKRSRSAGIVSVIGHADRDRRRPRHPPARRSAARAWRGAPPSARRRPRRSARRSGRGARSSVIGGGSSKVGPKSIGGPPGRRRERSPRTPRGGGRQRDRQCAVSISMRLAERMPHRTRCATARGRVEDAVAGRPASCSREVAPPLDVDARHAPSARTAPARCSSTASVGIHRVCAAAPVSGRTAPRRMWTSATSGSSPRACRRRRRRATVSPVTHSTGRATRRRGSARTPITGPDAAEADAAPVAIALAVDRDVRLARGVSSFASTVSSPSK